MESLRQEFSLPVEELNPFQRIVPPTDSLEHDILEQNPGQLAVAVGLALRSFEDLLIRIALLGVPKKTTRGGRRASTVAVTCPGR